MCAYDLPSSLETLIRVYRLLEQGNIEDAKRDLATQIKVVRIHLQANE